MASSMTLLPALLLWASQGEAVPHRGVERIMDQARQVQMADLKYWGRRTFRRQVIRERLDGEGQVPRLIGVRSDLVVAGKRVHKRNHFRYSEFSHPPAATHPTWE